MSTNNSVNTYIVPTTANEVTAPLQPAFLAYNSASDLNVTGAGTAYTVIFDTEVFDQNADYNNATGVFTAPVTGRYRFDAGVLVQGCTIATAIQVYIVTTARSYFVREERAASTAWLSENLSFLADMSATNTAHVEVITFGEAGDTDDVFGGAQLWTFFSGNLVC